MQLEIKILSMAVSFVRGNNHSSDYPRFTTVTTITRKWKFWTIFWHEIILDSNFRPHSLSRRINSTDHLNPTIEETNESTNEFDEAGKYDFWNIFQQEIISETPILPSNDRISSRWEERKTWKLLIYFVNKFQTPRINPWVFSCNSRGSAD